MKFSAIIVLATISGVAAGANRPQLSISVRDGNYDGLDGLDPTLTWENSQKSGDLDLSYGLSASARPTQDLSSLPRQVWGRASTTISGWGVAAKASVDAQKLNSADLQLDASNTAADLSLKLTAQAGGSFNVRTMEATKGMDVNGARVTITPRYDVDTDYKDVVINYAIDKTTLQLVASEDNQEVTFSQQIDANNRVAPTINNKGGISIEWERRLSDDSSVLASLKPNDMLNVEWRDSAWTANVNMPVDGTTINGANVHIKRDVSF